MNHEMVNEQTDLLCYRLRTARQRKRMARNGFEKKLRALDRERTELWQKERNLGWTELKPPIQRGWKRHFVLRGDVARSKQADFFQGILNKINTSYWSNRKDFRITRRRYKKDKLVERKQELQQPSEAHFKKLDFTEKESQLFYPKYEYNENRGRFEKRFVFVEPWRFVLKVKPNLITKTRVRDEAIESRIKEIDNYMTTNNFQTKLSKLKGCRYDWWRDEDFRRKNYEFKNVPLPQILDSIKEY